MDESLRPADDKLAAQSQRIAYLEGSKPVVYSGLEKLSIGPDDKTLFRWAQPGNTGNTGGGSSRPHGTSTWLPGPAGTAIGIKPVGQYDNFFFYCPMTYPSRAPKRLRFTAGDWAATPSDWAKSQQMEWQIEEFRDGWQYTCGWAVNPQTGLMYWAGTEEWKPLAGGSALRSLAQATFFLCEYSLDHSSHSFTIEWISVNGLTMPAGIKVPAVAAPIGKREYSIAVQLDGNSQGQPYSALLNNLIAEWE